MINSLLVMELLTPCHSKLMMNHCRQFYFHLILNFSSSCLNWYEHLTCNVEPWKPLTTRYNSYFLFLRLLGIFVMIRVTFRNLHSFMTGYHMELMNSKSQASMKARIYVKLHGKKILELSQLGLYHLISACLIVVLTSEASDMVMFLIAPIFISMPLDLIKM